MDKLLTVYFVDDEEWLLDELKGIVDWNSYGFTICGYNTDPFLAQEEILTLKPDLVICDIYMDGINGLRLAHNVRAKNTKTVFCFLSAYDKFEYAVSAIKIGAVDYLTKPIKVAELISVLNKLTAHELVENAEKVYMSAISGNEIKTSALKNALKEVLPEGARARFIVIHGDFVEGNTQEFLLDENLLFANEKDKIYLSFDCDLVKLQQTFVGTNLSVGVSPYINVEDCAVSLMEAVACSRQFFITGIPSVTVYKTNKKTEEFLKVICRSENKYELRMTITALKDFVVNNEVTVYDLGNIFNEITLCALKFGIYFEEFASAPQAIFEKFPDFSGLIKYLMNIFDAACSRSGNLIVDNIVKDIQLNYMKKQSLDEYAKKYGYNASYLSSLFKKEMKKSFMDYVIHYRIAKAKEYIVGTDESISRIAYQVGYNDYYHFAKAFKQNVGVSPTEYREYYGRKE